MKIYIGSDYRGFDLKQQIMRHLAETTNFEVIDKGPYEKVEGDDFNDAAIAVSKEVREDVTAFGILICGSAHGMNIQANRFKGIRAAHCNSPESAKLAREHDDANVLCLSAQFLDEERANQIVDRFLFTNFSNLERRIRRINRLDEREDYD